MTTYVFPGQASQFKGMGKELFPLFPDQVRIANEILGYSIEALCLEDPQNQLNNTAYTQPALYVTSALAYLKKQHETGTLPDYLAGHSLGEYNALFAAGVFDFATGLRLVQKRGQLMSQSTGGGMAAVVGLKSADVATILSTQTDVTIANYNSYTQVVITGKKAAVAALQPAFEKAGARFILLNVSGAFHSLLMQQAAEAFAQYLNQFTFSLPSISVIANVTGKPYQVRRLRGDLTQQMMQSVYWVQSIEYLLQQGETRFEEIGPGSVLTGLLQRIQKNQ